MGNVPPKEGGISFAHVVRKIDMGERAILNPEATSGLKNRAIVMRNSVQHLYKETKYRFRDKLGMTSGYF
jgi:hypothetical protein